MTRQPRLLRYAYTLIYYYEPEMEEQFLLKCAKTNDIRQKMVSDITGVLLQNGIVFQTLSLADKLKTMLSNVLVAKYVANFTILATEKKYKLLDM